MTQQDGYGHTMWTINGLTGDILIIDDTYEDIETLDNILREAGYHVRAVRDAESGLRAARSVVPDLVLLDIMLPDQDGFEVCQQLRADEQLKDVPVIFLSALHDVQLKAQAFEAGGYDYITKPYNDKEVLVRVRHQLERVHLWAKLQETARLEERQHIARELHDSVNQTLFVLSATIQSMLMDADDFSSAHQKQLQYINLLSRSAMAEMRTLLNELRPSQIRKSTIQKLLNQLVDAFCLRLNTEVHIVIADVTLPDEVKTTFYRITQEALNNAAKYAGAARLTVSLLDDGQCCRLIIEDNGKGFDPTHIHEGMGLHTMRERAENHDMGFKLESSPGKGTRIEVIWVF